VARQAQCGLFKLFDEFLICSTTLPGDNPGGSASYLFRTGLAIGSLIESLHDDADNLSIQNYSLDCQMGCDGNLDVTLSFGHEAEMVLLKIRMS
jgi:hypothetical protein